MTAATIFEGGRRRPFADLFAGTDSAGPATPATVSDPRGDPCLADFLSALERTRARCERSQIQDTLVEVTPREVQTVIDKAAKAKARYLAAVLELAEHDALPDSKQIETLETERTRHEAMQAGVTSLLAALRAGHVQVRGVAADRRDGGEAGASS
jgi:hypothetical protein